ncbi:ATP-dependent RNA helicase [Giardia muris]|uniref:ATP-dependent RNA helicase n=1 Tax=Giardia muris TaxID=5742 RepID=A0A4Z1T427_GIAMU|nr:ATP-dependent RNA helicase [Giardia muris]|eukprot:TNJ30408.1 ATP-dependent RNA helicase [Giardia muris]
MFQLLDDDDVLDTPEPMVASSTAKQRDEEAEKDVVILFNEEDFNAQSFVELGLREHISDVLKKYDITKPTPIQAKSLRVLLRRPRDLCGVSRTGSGKTLCFLLPMLQELSTDPYGIFGLVLTPTRELALQIEEQCNAYGNPLGIRALSLIGGREQSEQSILFDSRPHILIATPGRLSIHLVLPEAQQNLSRVKYLVLDEADRLLNGDQEFLRQLHIILPALPPITKRVTLFFTATCTPKLRSFLNADVNLGRFVEVRLDDKDMSLVTHLPQRYLLIHQPIHKPMWLAWIISMLSGVDINVRFDGAQQNKEYRLKDTTLDYSQVKEDDAAAASAEDDVLRVMGGVRSIIVFTDTCETCSLVEIGLQEIGLPVCGLHGLMPLAQRRQNLERFRRQAVRVLVATDLAARGLDIDTVDLVVNYSVPAAPEDYIHRVGRTCRAGRDGLAITFVERSDILRLRAIETAVEAKMAELVFIVDRTNTDRVIRIAEDVVLKNYFIPVSKAFKEAKLKMLEWGITAQKNTRDDRRRIGRAQAKA